MFDIIKKSMLTGLGFALVSKEKLDELVKEMVEKGNISEQEGRKLVQEMTGYAEKTRGELEKQVDKYVEKALNRMDLVRKSDLQEIRASIMEIQQRLDQKQDDPGTRPLS